MDAPKIQDEDLIRKIADKDLQAFKLLVDRYKVLVHNTCYNLLNDHHQAEEAAQDVFLKIYRSARSFRHRSKVSTWIYRIAVNHSLNLIRSKRRSGWIKSIPSSRREPSTREEILIGSSREEPDKLLDRKETRQILKSAVDSLPETQRAAFMLRTYENLSAREISKILDISIQSVESRIHRAKIHLQKKLVSLLKKSL